MKTAARLWRCLEALTGQTGVIADWRLELGDEFGAASAFLRPTAWQGSDYPCVNRFPCGFRHKVVFNAPSDIVAVCEEADCAPVRLQPADVVVMELNTKALGSKLAGLLGLEPGGGGMDGPASAELIGVDGPLRSPVYLVVANGPAELLRRAEALMAAQPAPFMLVTPTARHVGPELQGALARHGCVHLALEGMVAAGPGGKLVVIGSIEPVRAEFARRLGRTGNVVPVLEGLKREIADVKAGYQESVTARKRLEQAMAEGLLKFVGRIDAQSLRVIYAVLTKGDIAKAARQLGMKDSTLREYVGKWKRKGKDYAVLADLVRWRKETKFRDTVPLDEAVLAGEASDVDYGALVADVLDGLLMMTEGNWEDKREELAELLRPVAR